MGEARTFKVVAWGAGGKAEDLAGRKALLEFQEQVGRLEKAVHAALGVANETTTRLEQIKRALDHVPGGDPKLQRAARELEKRNRDILRALRGDTVLQARNESTPTSVQERVRYVLGSQRFSLGPPTATQRESYRIASEEFAGQLAKLRKLVEVDMKQLEKGLDDAGIPWTPGRLPAWKAK